MHIRKVLTLRGPNYWANYPCLEAWVDLGEYKDISSEMMPGFNERLMGWLPTMIEHRCSVGERGGFFQRLHRGTYLAHILEHVTLELQSLAGTPVGFGRARETSEEGVYKVAIEYKDERLAKACLETGHRLLMAAVDGNEFDVAGEVVRLRDLAHEVCLGPSTRSIVDAAVARGIPYRRLNNDSLVMLGQGAKQHRICAAETDRTSAIAEQIAQDKQMTRSLLKAVGVPVPEGRPVSDRDDAWEAAEDVGLPVVVKPQFGNHGRGVTTNCRTQEQVLAAYDNAREHGRDIVVEKYIPGSDYRLLVVGNKLVAAARRVPAHVVGDGQSTIAELVAEVNADPRRSEGHATVLSKINLDAIALGVLAELGYSPESVPSAGEVVLIRRNANLSTGGTAVDVTDEVHPLVAAQAVDAARVIGLDIAGVDVIALDIARPLAEQSGAVVEVNAGPGLRMHLQPSEGKPRPVGEAIIDLLYPEGQNGRIPLVAVTGVNGKTTTTRLITHILSLTGRTVGMTCTDGIYISGRRIDAGDCSGPQSARSVLLHPGVEAAVLETARGGILREGLGFDRCDVAVVTNIGEGDHLGLNDIDSLEKLARVKRCIVDVVAPTGAAVLNAEDPLVAEMATHCPGSVVFFAKPGEHPLLQERRGIGGRVAFVRENSVVLADGSNEFPLISLDKVPLTHGGKVTFQVENVLAATAACWALGIPAEFIRAGLESFGANIEKTQGRFNLFDFGGATMVVDYGHNASSLLAMLQTLEQLPHARRCVLYSAAGDRRDEDMVRQGEILGNAFDRVVLYEDHYLRGRQPGEIMNLFNQGVGGAKRVKETEQLVGWKNAIERVLQTAKAGELWLVQADTIDETVAYMKSLQVNNAVLREITLKEAMEGTSGSSVVSMPIKAPQPTRKV
jgi:cyanophycin synthetase